MIVSAHQPAFVPWLGYLDKLAKSSLFVVMDDLPFEPANFQHRQRLKLGTESPWIEVPITPGQGDRILDQRIATDTAWQERTWQAIERHYGRAPHFARYADEVHAVFARPWTRLVELDLEMLELARRWLGIPVPIMRSSSLDLAGETLTERLLDLCKRVGAHAYLAGRGTASTTLDAEKLGRAGLGVIWQHFDHPAYDQRYPEQGFVANLGFLDLVFNCGEASSEILFPRTHPLHAHAAR